MKSIAQLSERSSFGVILFDAAQERYPPVGPPREATPGAKKGGTAWVLSKDRGTGKCPRPALLDALGWANQLAARRKAIIFISSGGASCGGQEPRAYQQQTIAQVTARNVARVPINTICIGSPSPVEVEWMRDLAARNQGTFLHVADE